MVEQGPSIQGIDTSRPHPARMYDYYLGGKDNYEIDREAAERVIAMAPEARPSARANRQFLRRALQHVVARGVRQVIDIGTGIPTSPNTHEVARAVAPDVRVVYVDNDPIVATHAEAKLTNTPGTGFLLADARAPRHILGHPTVRELIDFDQPVAVLLLAVLHFVRDEEDPAALVATLRDALPAGSFLVLSHGTSDFHRAGNDANEVYRAATASLHLRSRPAVEALFAGLDLLEPGVVQASRWRPDPAGDGDAADDRVAFYGGVGLKR
ncbi:SAM-dependent methyltransferase [Streptomyces sp. NPDC057702]|uniref:SAM-dependent methyltransferase n=1 Tax=unclassified Streptomyces TaxID=2593676 RepID=UPI0036B2444D